MLRLTISVLLIISSLQLNYSQSKIQQIKPEKILYKSIDSIDLFLHIYRPKSFDKSKVYNCIIFFSWGSMEHWKLQVFSKTISVFCIKGLDCNDS